jgi:HSP20 family molecular chaperone IbpA
MLYFRRPQTPFVQKEGSQKPQSQWKIVADGTVMDDDADDEPKANGNSLGLGGDSGHAVAEDLVEKDPEPGVSATRESSEPEGLSSCTSDSADDDSDIELATSLDKRLQLEIKDHPESVLLCGYFHEEVVDDFLTLSTYLPGVHPREIRVYYGECVLKIAGARALYNLVQRFERSFALDDRLVNTQDIQAILQEGMLLIRVPLLPTPPPPVKISVVYATPMIHFMNRSDLFCLDIDVPGVQLKDLTIEYNNGTLRLIWERLEPAVGQNHKTMMRFERIIPINTLQIDTTQINAYLNHPTKFTGVLTIVAPYKFKRTTRPIEVRAPKSLELHETEANHVTSDKD